MANFWIQAASCFDAIHSMTHTIEGFKRVSLIALVLNAISQSKNLVRFLHNLSRKTVLLEDSETPNREDIKSCQRLEDTTLHLTDTAGGARPHRPPLRRTRRWAPPSCWAPPSRSCCGPDPSASPSFSRGLHWLWADPLLQEPL